MDNLVVNFVDDRCIVCVLKNSDIVVASGLKSLGLCTLDVHESVQVTQHVEFLIYSMLDAKL